jgi:uncharacterized coiled-coil protein SlyX
MSSAGFDTLRFSRGLREAGVPEELADRQAELMAEAFSAFADKLVTKDYFSEVLAARLSEQTALLDQRMAERIAEQDAKFEARFIELEQKFEARFIELEQKFEARFIELDQKFEARFIELEQKFEARFFELDQKFEPRFATIDARFAGQDARFARLERTLLLHTWMLGLITVVQVVPQLQAWLA